LGKEPGGVNLQETEPGGDVESEAYLKFVRRKQWPKKARNSTPEKKGSFKEMLKDSMRRKRRSKREENQRLGKKIREGGKIK